MTGCAGGRDDLGTGTGICKGEEAWLPSARSNREDDKLKSGVTLEAKGRKKSRKRAVGKETEREETERAGLANAQRRRAF